MSVGNWPFVASVKITTQGGVHPLDGSPTHPWHLSVMARGPNAQGSWWYSSYFVTREETYTALAEARLRSEVKDWRIFQCRNDVNDGPKWNLIEEQGGQPCD